MEVNNKKEIMESANEESTIFAAPSEHIDKGVSSKHSLLKKIIAAVLCVAVLAGATVAVVKLIPEKEIEEIGMNQGEAVLNVDPTQITKITVTHSTATLVLTSAMVENDDKKLEQQWTLEGYDNSLIDQTSLAQIASYAAVLTSYGEYEDVENELYGMGEPKITVTVEGTAGDPYTIKVGNDTADGVYSYVSLSTQPDKIYVVNSGTMKGFVVEPLDLAISTAIPKIEKTDNNAKYFDSEGKLYSFDTLTISGSRFDKKLVFKPNTQGEFSDYATYICTSPLLRVAQGVEDVTEMFTNGVAASGVVCFDQSAENIKKFGLDNPQWVITLSVAGEQYTYRITATDDTNTEFFVASSTDKMIRTVTVSNLAFISYEEKDFYLGFMALESIKEIGQFVLSGDINATFDITYDEDNEKYIVKNDGNVLEDEAFQNFYAEFVQVTAIDYNTVSTSAKPSLTIVMKHNNDTDDTVLTFTKISDSRYQYTSGGHAMGQIPSSSYDRLLRLVQKLIP
ncbi:MAG: DUF4340 domain-containing protein [Acutalibacteraceae bacterium]|nr:DUF4340 domain-containing protein [Acutalibacteraceae bacterium]